MPPPALNALRIFNVVLSRALERVNEKDYSSAREDCLLTAELAALLVREADDKAGSQHFKQIRVGLVMIANQAVSLKALVEASSDAHPQSSLPTQAKAGEPTSMNQQSNIASSIRFSSIMGNESAKQALYENIVLPMTLERAHRDRIYQGVRSGIGNVLLFGPPGNGKTLLAQAAAAESCATLFCVRPSDVLSKYQGESERYLSRLFDSARQAERAVILLDEFDSIACSRTGGEDGAQSRRLLSELLLQLTHQKQLQQSKSLIAGNIAVIAATNRLGDLDEAVIRRFDAKVLVALPELLQRQSLVERYLVGIDNSLSRDDVLRVAHLCEGFSGSEIEMLSREAAMVPLRAHFSYGSSSDSAAAEKPLRAVSFEDFSNSFCTIMNVKCCGPFEEMFEAACETPPMA